MKRLKDLGINYTPWHQCHSYDERLDFHSCEIKDAEGTHNFAFSIQKVCNI